MPAWVPPATRMLSPAATDGLEEAGGLRRSACRARPARRGECACSTNLRMLTAMCRRVMSGMTTCSREPSGSIASTNGRATGRCGDREVRSIRSTSSATCPARQDRRGQLAAAAPGDEHPARLVDPDLLDLRVVEVALQRPEAGHPVEHVADDGLRVADRRQRRGQRPLGVVGDDVAHQHPHRRRVGERVEPAPADQLADLAVDDVEQSPRRHGTPVEQPLGRLECGDCKGTEPSRAGLLWTDCDEGRPGSPDRVNLAAGSATRCLHPSLAARGPTPQPVGAGRPGRPSSISFSQHARKSSLR